MSNKLLLVRVPLSSAYEVFSNFVEVDYRIISERADFAVEMAGRPFTVYLNEVRLNIANCIDINTCCIVGQNFISFPILKDDYLFIVETLGKFIVPRSLKWYQEEIDLLSDEIARDPYLDLY